MHYRRKRRRHTAVLLIITLISLCAILTSAYHLKSLTTQIAVSDAADMVSATVNKVVCEMIDRDAYDLDYFVNFQKDSDGNITAISGNMAHINALSAQILGSIIASTDAGSMTVDIPFGSLLGSNLLMGKGPEVTVEILLLTSSAVDFKSEVSSCGINQTSYQLFLEIKMDVDVLVPWGTESATVLTEVLIADTVLVGKIPETYLNVEK